MSKVQACTNKNGCLCKPITSIQYATVSGDSIKSKIMSESITYYTTYSTSSFEIVKIFIVIIWDSTLLYSKMEIKTKAQQISQRVILYEKSVIICLFQMMIHFSWTWGSKLLTFSGGGGGGQTYFWHTPYILQI